MQRKSGNAREVPEPDQKSVREMNHHCSFEIKTAHAPMDMNVSWKYTGKATVCQGVLSRPRAATGTQTDERPHVRTAVEPLIANPWYEERLVRPQHQPEATVTTPNPRLRRQSRTSQGCSPNNGKPGAVTMTGKRQCPQNRSGKIVIRDLSSSRLGIRDSSAIPQF